MRYEVLSKIKVRTKAGELEVHPGQVIAISPEKAQPFVEKGKIIPLEEQDNIQDYGTLIKVNFHSKKNRG